MKVRNKWHFFLFDYSPYVYLLTYVFVLYFLRPDQAFLVEDVYLVSFDGHLFKLPASCDFILAADVIQHTFSIVLKSDRFKRRSLVVQMQNTKIAIHPNGEVHVPGFMMSNIGFIAD